MSREARPRVEGQPVPAFAATRGARARVVGSTRASPPDARAERCGVERRSRARSSTTALFFYFSRTAASRDSQSRHLRSSVSRNAATMVAARPVAVSYATSAVECFVALASYGTQSPKSASGTRNRSSNRRLFFLSFPGELFFPSSVSLCEGHFRGGIFARPRVCLRSLEFPRKLSGISLVVATAKQERSVVRALRLIRHALVLLPTLIGAGDTAGGRWL